MRNLLAFFRRFRVFLIFVVFQVLALGLFFSKHIYPRNVVVGSTSKITGNILFLQNKLTSYLNLDEENEQLAETVERLLESSSFGMIDSLEFESIKDSTILKRFDFEHAHVISGGTKLRNNFFTLDKGSKDGIEAGVGVIGPSGIIGFATDVNRDFTLVKTVLSQDVNIDAMIQKNRTHGLLKWDGRSPNRIQLSEITNDIDVELGDTIVTRGSSGIFPRNYPVGVVDEIEPNNGAVYLTIHIRLAENMNKAFHTFTVKDLMKEQFQEQQLKVIEYNAK